MNSRKNLIVISLLILAILISYFLPKAKYSGTGFITELKIPETVPGWVGKNVTEEVGLINNSSTYDFVSGALAYQYINEEGKTLLFIILDAGNFHHPKVCFTGAGFKIKELPDTEFHIPNHTLKTHTLFTERERSNNLSFYWIVIDKDVAHEWIEQKAKQLFFSVFGKKRVGLMVRIDVPARESDIQESTVLAEQFINDLNRSIPPGQAGYIFGMK